MTTSTESFRCTSCGGAVPVADLQATVACPYCRRPHGIDSARIAAAARYSHDVGAAALVTDSVLSGAKAYKALHVLTLAFAVLVFSCVAASMVWPQQFDHGIATHKNIVKSVFFGFLAAYSSFWFIPMFRRPRTRAATCPGCGADVHASLEQALNACEHCGLAFMATSEGLSVATEDQRWALRREQWAAVKRGRRVGARWHAVMGAVGTFWVRWSFPSMMVAGICVFKPWLGGLLLAVAVAVAIALRSRRNKRLRAFAERGRRAGWTPLDRPASDDWLDRFWLMPDRRPHVPATFTIAHEGYTAMAEFSGLPGRIGTRTTILLPLWNRQPAPRLEAQLGSPELEPFVQAASHRGFRLGWCDGGLWALGSIGRDQLHAVSELVAVLTAVARRTDTPPAPDMAAAEELEAR